MTGFGQTPDHKLILTKCEAILGVPKISENSNFLQLGGDSLQAIEISGMLSALYGKEVELEVVLGAPTFGDLLDDLDDLDG